MAHRRCLSLRIISIFVVTCFPLTSWVELHLRSIELLYEPDLKISFMCKLVQQAHATCHVFMELHDYSWDSAFVGQANSN